MLHLFAHILLASSQAGPVTPADSAPVMTMTLVKHLQTAQRKIDSLAKKYPFAVYRVPEKEWPRSAAGQITLWTAAVKERPVFLKAVKQSGFENASAHAEARVWLTIAWGLVIAERGRRDTAALENTADSTYRGFPHQAIDFVRSHENDLVKAGFTPPPPLDVSPNNNREHSTPSDYVRQFYDSSAHAIRIATSIESDHLQGFIDSVDGTPRGKKPEAPLHVIFLGNSLTYYYAMPRLFAHLAAAGLHRKVVAGLVSIPGTSLPHLWEGSDVGTVLQKFPWDAIVMQARPDGLNDTSAIDRAAALIAAPVVAHGGHPFVWSQYLAPGAHPAFAAIIDTIAASTARAAQGSVTPVREAWDAVCQADSALWLRLFDDLPHGDAHPSPLGSYLLAITSYRSITGQSPVGLPTKLGDFEVPKADAERLQKIVASLPKH